MAPSERIRPSGVRWVEMIGMYVGAPVLYVVFARRLPGLLFPGMWLWALVCVVVLLRDRGFERRRLGWAGAGGWLGPSLLVTVVGMAGVFAMVLLLRPDSAFELPRERPRLWIAIMVLYPVFSVWPQEIIWRVYFTHRYSGIMPAPGTRILVSGVVFGFAHLMFPSPWVAITLSGLGGLVFAYAYERWRVIGPAVVLHAVLGCWVFTAGLGSYFYAGRRHAPPAPEVLFEPAADGSATRPRAGSTPGAQSGDTGMAHVPATPGR